LSQKFFFFENLSFFGANLEFFFEILKKFSIFGAISENFEFFGAKFCANFFFLTFPEKFPGKYRGK
jgi:hypothetical protein